MTATRDLAAELALLVDREAIRALVADFARRIDTKDQAGYAANFAENGVLELPFGAIEGRAAIAASPGPRHTFATAHLLGNPVIEPAGDRAQVRTPMQATHVLSEGDAPGWAGGWYEQDVVRTAEGWRFARVRLVVAWTAGEPMTRPGPGPTSASQEPGDLPPMPFAPEPDQVAGPDTDIMHGLVLDYTYSGGRHYRLLFDHDHHVTFEMPDHALHAPGAGPSPAPVLSYRAREIRPGMVLVHWIVKEGSIHVALTVDLEEKKLHVGAMMPPNRWEFFDTAVIHGVTRVER